MAEEAIGPEPRRRASTDGPVEIRWAETLARGVEAISAEVRVLPLRPGVYRMLDAAGAALYVGKARNLRKRVSAYTRPGRLPPRLHRMIAETQSLEVITTHTEAEALLLEAQPDQGTQAPLQHPDAGRQVVPLHPADGGS